MTDLIVVDVANVVGSRPDRWWRDRAGATRRLFVQVLDARFDGLVLVVEGAARAGVEVGEYVGVRVVHAAGSGDDAIVDVVASEVATGQSVTVVTSDRELRQRVAELGADLVGPGWLLEQLG